MRNTFRRVLFSTFSARLLGLVALLYTVYYLYWRARYSLNMDALLLSLPLLLAEFQGTFNFALFLLMTWDVTPVPHDPGPPGHFIDILIPTYNEDLSILKMTILGALNVSYPHKTWVLDDGRRPAMRQLCQEIGVEYLTLQSVLPAADFVLCLGVRRNITIFVAGLDQLRRLRRRRMCCGKPT